MKQAANKVNNWSDLKTFDSLKQRTSTPTISINKGKTLSFNAGFRRQTDIANRAILSYCPSKKAIVFEFAKETEKRGLKITSNYTLGIKSFFNCYGIDAKYSDGQYQPILEAIPKKGKCWVIYLDKKIQTI